MSFFASLLSFFASLFGGGKTVVTDSSAQTETQSASAADSTLPPIPVDDPDYVEGTRMKKSTFDYAVCDEPTQEAKDFVKSEMQKKDLIGVYPYTITTDKNIYEVKRNTDRYGNDYTAVYGTAISTTMRHK